MPQGHARGGRSRSRTSASTSTRASTTGRSSAPACATSSPARPCRAARRSPSSWCARSTSRTRSATSSARSARPSSPPSSRRSTPKNWILREYLNSVPFGTVERPHRGGHRGRGAQIFFAKHAREPRLARGGAARRPAAGAVAVQPVPQPAAPRSSAATRCCARWPRTASSRASRPTSAAIEAARPAPRPPLHAAPRAVLLRLRRGAADRGVRRRRLPPRRAQDPHHDRPEAAGGGARRRSPASCPIPSDPSSAIVSIDPRTGYIKAMASSGTYKDRTFNLAAQGHRQPGSAFKTFVLVTALRQGVQPQLHQLHVAAARPQRARLRPLEGLDLRRHLRRQHGPRPRRRCARTTPSTRSSTSTSGPKNVRETARADGHRDQARRDPGRGPRRPAPGRLAARDGERLRDAGLGRDAQQAEGDHARSSSPTARPTSSASPSASACSSDWVALRGDEDPRAERQGRHGHGGADRLPRGRQDGHHRQLQRRLVRGLHARTCPRSVWVGYPNALHRDAQRARHQRGRAARSRRRSGSSFMTVAEGHQLRRRSAPSSRRSVEPFYGKYASHRHQLGQRTTATPAATTGSGGRRARATTGGRRGLHGVRPAPLRLAAAGGARTPPPPPDKPRGDEPPKGEAGPGNGGAATPAPTARTD